MSKGAKTFRVGPKRLPVRTVSTQYPFVIITAGLAKAQVASRTRDEKTARRAFANLRNDLLRNIDRGPLAGPLLGVYVIDPGTGRELAAIEQKRDALGHLQPGEYSARGWAA